MNIPVEARLVCIVGANGSGKSNLLNLVSGVAFHFGLSPGLDPERRPPLAEYADLEVELMLEGEVRERAIGVSGLHADWDGSLVLNSAAPSEAPQIMAMAKDGRTVGAQNIVNYVRQDAALHYLEIDSNRSYPSSRQNLYTTVAQALQAAPPTPATLRAMAFRTVRAMYDSWVQYMIRQDLDYATARSAQERDALRGLTTPAAYVDPWATYNSALSVMLPYLYFSRFAPQSQGLLYRSHGVEVPFEDLSSGEQEIAFIVGQIERFKLQRGLLLLDEPELHLNHELVRRWVTNLRDSVYDGQVWIATHSLEAVEAAEASCTYLLERTAENATPITTLENAPSIRLLSAALGSPAYAAERTAYVFIEGLKGGSRQRERFENLVKEPGVTFVEVAGSADVRHYAGALHSLRLASGNPLRVGGIIDRDVRSEQSIRMMADEGLLVLACHEIENLYVEPNTVRAIASSLEQGVDAELIIRDRSHRGAGRWCSQAALSMLASRPLLGRGYGDHVATVHWEAIERDPEGIANQIADLLLFHPSSPRADFIAAFLSAVTLFKAYDDDGQLWCQYFGKELLSVIYKSVGFSRASAYEAGVLRAWTENSALVPEAAHRVREYVATIVNPS